MCACQPTTTNPKHNIHSKFIINTEGRAWARNAFRHRRCFTQNSQLFIYCVCARVWAQARRNCIFVRGVMAKKWKCSHRRTHTTWNRWTYKKKWTQQNQQQQTATDLVWFSLTIRWLPTFSLVFNDRSNDQYLKAVCVRRLHLFGVIFLCVRVIYGFSSVLNGAFVFFSFSFSAYLNIVLSICGENFNWTWLVILLLLLVLLWLFFSTRSLSFFLSFPVLCSSFSDLVELNCWHFDKSFISFGHWWSWSRLTKV